MLGLVGYDKHVVDEPEGIGKCLADHRVVVADPHVLVHHSLASFARLEVPVGALREWVDDEVARAFAAEQRLLLFGGLLHILRRADPAAGSPCVTRSSAE